LPGSRPEFPFLIRIHCPNLIRNPIRNFETLAEKIVPTSCLISIHKIHKQAAKKKYFHDNLVVYWDKAWGPGLLKHTVSPTLGARLSNGQSDEKDGHWTVSILFDRSTSLGHMLSVCIYELKVVGNEN
jgi:hypothetical protein